MGEDITDESLSTEAEAVRERQRALFEQNEAMRTELYRQALLANGFRDDGKTYSRRFIYEDLRGPDPNFSHGYRPTLAEQLNRALGEGNWTTLPSGEVEDEPDPHGDETPEITHWQNTKLHIYTRNLDEQRTSVPNTVGEIFGEVDAKFPRLTTNDTQEEKDGKLIGPDGNVINAPAEMSAAVEAAAVRSKPVAELPEEPEEVRRARHAAIEAAAARKEPIPEPQDISEEERRLQSDAVEAAAVRPVTESQAGQKSETEIDAALRERPPKPPLTEAEIADLTAQRGMRPTDEEIDSINSARAAGIHTGIS